MIKLKITDHALKLIVAGYQGNGCGSGVISKTLCWTAQRAIGVDLALVWLYHDAEYSIEMGYKSPDHKIMADSYAHHNINVLAGVPTNKRTHTFKAVFAKVIHSILVLFGSSSYWS
jgi:hypothetical protein